MPLNVDVHSQVPSSSSDDDDDDVRAWQQPGRKFSINYKCEALKISRKDNGVGTYINGFQNYSEIKVENVFVHLEE